MRCLLCKDNLPCKFHGPSDYDRGYKDGYQSATEQMKLPVEALEQVRLLAGNIKTVPQLRAWATQENRETKAALIRITSQALATIEQGNDNET